MNVLLGGLIALTVLWADSWQFRPRDFAAMLMIGLILRVHAAIVQRETIAAIRADTANNGPISTLRDTHA